MSAVMIQFHEAMRLSTLSVLAIGEGGVLTSAAKLPNEVTSRYPLDGGFFFTRKLGLMASMLTPMSCGLLIAPFSSNSSNLSCNSASIVFGYHGTSFNLVEGGKALGMCMTASTLPNSPFYLGRSVPKIFLEFLARGCEFLSHFRSQQI